MTVRTKANGGTRGPSPVDPEQRAAAWRRLLPPARPAPSWKARLKRGGTDLQQVLKDAETDEILGKMKVCPARALPRMPARSSRRLNAELEIAPTRRLRGLGDRQRKALLERFSS